ncbi:MAG: hypothetical protein ABGZ17_28085, partial [Planctomycetaceae bacterium]
QPSNNELDPVELVLGLNVPRRCAAYYLRQALMSRPPERAGNAGPSAPVAITGCAKIIAHVSI